MDLNQRKLNRSEWNSIEVPVSKYEIEVLNMIMKGYHDVNIRINNNNSIFTFLKIEYTEKMEDFIYNKHLRVRGDNVEDELIKINLEYEKMKINSIVKLNSIDKIRLDRFDEKRMTFTNLFCFLILKKFCIIIKSSRKM